jgi:hypothetical protein
MARILRAKNPSSPKTPRHVGASVANAGTEKRSGSWHDPAQLVSRIKSKRSVRTLMARSDTSRKDMTGEFTNNPNPKFDPSRAPGSVKKSTSVTRMSVGAAGRGHSKIFKPNRQTLFGGKILKRKQF